MTRFTDPQDWYARRAELAPGQIFEAYDGAIMRLDRRVPGDGTQWYADIWLSGHWSAEDCRIEPGELARRIETYP